MYLFSTMIVLFIAFAFTDFKWQTNNCDNLKSAFSWIAFTINGPLNFNAFRNTSLIDAGVTWTLPYEWMFYLSLPFIAMLLKINSSFKTLLLFGILFLIIYYFNGISTKYLYSFVGGILMAICIKNYKFKKHLQTNFFSIIGILMLGASVVLFKSGTNPIAVIISTFVCFLIVNGNNFFRILSNKFSRKFGQITHSLYLVHGIILFITFNCFIGSANIIYFSKEAYWLVIYSLIFPIVLISQITYKYIELPLMNYIKINK